MCSNSWKYSIPTPPRPNANLSYESGEWNLMDRAGTPRDASTVDDAQCELELRNEVLKLRWMGLEDRANDLASFIRNPHFALSLSPYSRRSIAERLSTSRRVTRYRPRLPSLPASTD